MIPTICNFGGYFIEHNRFGIEGRSPDLVGRIFHEDVGIHGAPAPEIWSFCVILADHVGVPRNLCGRSLMFVDEAERVAEFMEYYTVKFVWRGVAVQPAEVHGRANFPGVGADIGPRSNI